MHKKKEKKEKDARNGLVDAYARIYTRVALMPGYVSDDRHACVCREGRASFAKLLRGAHSGHGLRMQIVFIFPSFTTASKRIHGGRYQLHCGLQTDIKVN